MRVNLSVAIVYMVNNTALYNTTNTSNEGPFLWDESQQGIILGMFFYGYVLTQVPGGRVAEVLTVTALVECQKSSVYFYSVRQLVGSG